MGNLVNLRRAKKAKARAEAEHAAAANRASFGTPKAARDLTKARSEKARRDLEGGRLEPDKALKD
jgi:hypothetical protein